MAKLNNLAKARMPGLFTCIIPEESKPLKKMTIIAMPVTIGFT